MDTVPDACTSEPGAQSETRTPSLLLTVLSTVLSCWLLLALVGTIDFKTSPPELLPLVYPGRSNMSVWFDSDVGASGEVTVFSL